MEAWEESNAELGRAAAEGVAAALLLAEAALKRLEIFVLANRMPLQAPTALRVVPKHMPWKFTNRNYQITCSVFVMYSGRRLTDTVIGSGKRLWHGS
jgi:hypothetical protein